jgi:hypothetical protein
MAEGDGAGRSSEPLAELAGPATPCVVTPWTVFLSYASPDATIAQTIVESLETQGLRCWIAPRDVRPGTQYADAIVRAINEARLSFWCYRRMRLHRPMSARKWSGRVQSASRS